MYKYLSIEGLWKNIEETVQMINFKKKPGKLKVGMEADFGLVGSLLTVSVR